MHLGLGIAGTTAVSWAAPALAPVVPAVASALRVPRTRDTGGVVLTFDDGPHRQGTPAVLDRLERADARAIFFLVGEQVERDPGLAREVRDRGHAIALHGYRHRNLLRIPPTALRADYDRGLDVIARATGVVCDTYRPPYGIFSLAAIVEVRRRGWHPLLWSRWGRDWARRATPGSVARLALRDIGAGDVVLLHDADHYSVPDSWRATVGALDLMLPVLAQRGLA
jgi:peptidoglycan/xylan/chitin deacetylase (PgdA/CDA1 family)